MLGHFDIGSLRHKRLQSGAESVFFGPHNSFGIDPGEIRIEQFVRGRFIPFGERGFHGLVRRQDGILSNGPRPARYHGRQTYARDPHDNQIPDQMFHVSSLNETIPTFYYIR
jgi:hypothetical protein